MDLQYYKAIYELDTAPFSRVSVPAFSGTMREICDLIDPNQQANLGLPNNQNNFYNDFDSAISSIEEGFAESASSAETGDIQTNIDTMKSKGSSINEGLDSMSKGLSGDLLVIATRIHKISHNFVTARQRANKEFVEECNSICDKLLEGQNAQDFKSLSPAMFSIVEELKELTLTTKALYEKRSKESVLKYTEEKREVCTILYTYLRARVLAKVNCDNPSQQAIDFIKEHNRVVKDARTSYNLKQGQLHHEEDPTEDPTVEENIRTIKVDVQDIKEELL